MNYNKIFEVSQDLDRVYFRFYAEKRIIALPKPCCKNKAVYVGEDFSKLMILDTKNAGILFSDWMRKSISHHPLFLNCIPMNQLFPE